MIRTVKNAILASALVGTCAIAGTVTAPDSIDITISGDAEIKFDKEKVENNAAKTNHDYRTAEVNLYLNAMLENGIGFYSTFKVFDGTQAQTTAGADSTDDGFKTKEAYAIVPIMKKAKLIAGLKEDAIYGTDAFDNADQFWRVALIAPIAKGITARVVSKIENEEESDKNKGDNGATVLRVDGKFDSIEAGLKYASVYQNKDDGFIAGNQADSEKEADVLGGYVMGEISGFDFAAEYMKKDIDFVGSSQSVDQDGYFLGVGTGITEDLSVGLAYVSLSDGLKGGGEFAPGLILDGNVDSLGKNLDTNAFVLPVSYAINDVLSANLTYIHAKIEDGNSATNDNAREIDLGVEYTYNESLTIGATYGDYDTKADSKDDIQKFEVALNITF